MNLNILESNAAFSADTLDRDSVADLYESINPVSGEVSNVMKDNNKNPDSLKVAAVEKDANNESAHLYVEALDFASFLEANGYSIEEGKNSIIEHYTSDNDSLNNAELHVVFPSECLKKNTLGIENLGKSVAGDWPMQLMRGCRRYGITVNTSIDKETVNGKDTVNKGEMDVSVKGLNKKETEDFVKKFKDSITKDKLQKFEDVSSDNE